MRVLVATDGSRAASRAIELVARLRWPAGSVIEIVGVVPAVCDIHDRYAAEIALDMAVAAIARPGLSVERLVLNGRPGSVIVDEARACGADLVVVGNRGTGRLRAMLLGSVSAEVVDHAPGPVLVVRRPEVDGVVVADDGSPSARAAASILASWPIFRAAPTTVVCVAETGVPLGSAVSPGLYGEIMASYQESVDDLRAQATAIAERGAEALRRAGFQAIPEVREGQAAHEIVESAVERGADLIVVGTRGHTGLARLLLGSVARNVLLHAACSVLVVRERTPARIGEREVEPERVRLRRTAPTAI